MILITLVVAGFGGACSQANDRSGSTATSAGRPSPLNRLVDLEEAERLVGADIQLPGYVTEGLAQLNQVTVATEPEANATVVFALNGSLPPEEITLAALHFTQWASDATHKAFGNEKVDIGRTELTVGSYNAARDEVVVLIDWRQGDRAFQVVAFGWEGITEEVVRREALRVVESLLDH